MNKNQRQAHAVNVLAGKKHSAESWGTGRAVARVPRISGSGSHRSGQAAFANFARKGHMFAPLKVWRRWHRRINIRQKRHAAAVAVAASGIPALVMARGHRIDQVQEIPLVFNDKLEQIEKTKEAVNFLKAAGAYDDVKRVIDSQTLRAGKGKMRNKRYALRKGPLIIVGNEHVKIERAFRNLPGVEIINVNRLNLLKLAPGGQLGRFVIWTESAFRQVNSIFGTFRYDAPLKDEYHLNRPLMTNPDIAKIINSNEVQSAVRSQRKTNTMHTILKRNPITNHKALYHLNPYAATHKATARTAQEANLKKRQAAMQEGKSRANVLTAEEKQAKKEQTKVSKAIHKKLSERMTDAATKKIRMQ